MPRHIVCLTFDFDTQSGFISRGLTTPTPLSRGEFGLIGARRILALLKSHGIRATWFTPGFTIESHPKACEEVVAAGHEIGHHSWAHIPPATKSRTEEEADLVRANTAIEKLTGRKPVGTRSSHSREFLLDEGYIYTSEDSFDHRPNWHSNPDGSRPLLNLPFHYAIDDAMFFSFAWLGSDNSAQRMMDPDHVEEIWWQAFLQQYQQGGYLNIVMHPFVSGRALRIAMLDRLINRMKALPGVWFPTCEQVARHILKVAN
jgi:peptidoglycan/xylan/chitin deacetylase (PgdA/CDA1 family)